VNCEILKCVKKIKDRTFKKHAEDFVQKIVRLYRLNRFFFIFCVEGNEVLGSDRNIIIVYKNKSVRRSGKCMTK